MPNKIALKSKLRRKMRKSKLNRKNGNKNLKMRKRTRKVKKTRKTTKRKSKRNKQKGGENNYRINVVKVNVPYKDTFFGKEWTIYAHSYKLELIKNNIVLCNLQVFDGYNNKDKTKIYKFITKLIGFTKSERGCKTTFDKQDYEIFDADMHTYLYQGLAHAGNSDEHSTNIKFEYAYTISQTKAGISSDAMFHTKINNINENLKKHNTYMSVSAEGTPDPTYMEGKNNPGYASPSSVSAGTTYSTPPATEETYIEVAGANNSGYATPSSVATEYNKATGKEHNNSGDNNTYNSFTPKPIK